MDIERALRNMPSEVRDRVKTCIRKYYDTGKYEYAEMAISILEKFDDSEIKELVKTLKKR